MHSTQHREGLRVPTGSHGVCLRCGLVERRADIVARRSARYRRLRTNAMRAGFDTFPRRAFRAPVQGEQS
ncbi:hypothetical protein CFB84_19020 [Burkholderia aenigmatica]|uniref:Uncharacterized protein n=1 Tax=Burkholderia aenigmatica TaxID=2015348 RepID=A0A228IMP2_9BURK|nr:hypothetical protein CFB84_19020 [Burkholderia aenigmatica]